MKTVVTILLVAVGLSSMANAADKIVIAGDKNGACSPNMPMPKPKVPVQIQLNAGPKDSFSLDSDVANLHLKAAAGKSAIQTVTFPSKGNYNFSCGGASLPVNKRTQGMFMVM